MLMKNNEGFSIVELLLVTIVVAFLVAAGLVVSRDTRHKNQVSLTQKDYCLKGLCFTYPVDWNVKNFYVNPIQIRQFTSPDKKIQVQYASSTILSQQILCDSHSSNCSFMPTQVEAAPNLGGGLIVEGVINQSGKLEPVIFMTSSSLLKKADIKLKAYQNVSLSYTSGIPTATIRPVTLQPNNGTDFSLGLSSNNTAETVSQAEAFLDSPDAKASLKIIESTRVQ
jgi:hypothetical protein